MTRRTETFLPYPSLLAMYPSSVMLPMRTSTSANEGYRDDQTEKSSTTEQKNESTRLSAPHLAMHLNAMVESPHLGGLKER